ncbi:chemotaxis protein [Thermopirellula anaerolimosa]
MTTLTNNSRAAALEPLFAAATHEASTAMCRWTNGEIQLSLDEVLEVPLDRVTEVLQLGDDLLTMVALDLLSDSGTVILLIFDEINGRQLAATLLREPCNPNTEWSEMEKSALTETGNILGCAYMNALTKLVGRPLVPSPPYFIQDYGASVVQQALMAQAMESDTVLVCRTGFHRRDEDLNWHVLLLPSVSLRQNLERVTTRTPSKND